MLRQPYLALKYFPCSRYVGCDKLNRTHSPRNVHVALLSNHYYTVLACIPQLIKRSKLRLFYLLQ